MPKKNNIIAPQVDPYTKLLSYAFWLIGRRDYTERDIVTKLTAKKKLKGWDVSIDHVIERLKELNYIDDRRFVERYIESRTLGNPRGRYLIGRELAFKGIPRALFDELWERVGVSEINVARAFLERKKSALLRATDPKKRRQKIMSLLNGRGFSPDTIYAILDL
ncbi:MAG: regulatory protein RecX [Patescibacteria group bacterium]